MSVINTQPLAGASGQGDTGYNLTKSLRFRQAASAYLSRTPSSTSDRQKFTYSLWMKRGSLSSNQRVIQSRDDNTAAGNNFTFLFNDADKISVIGYASGYQVQLITTQVFRDPSAWYHIVLAVDTTQATDSSRVKLYVNGSQVTSFTTATYPSQNTNLYWNVGSQPCSIGRYSDAGGSSLYFFDGYIAEANIIDGSQQSPSSFGETDIITGVWKPKRYAGTYGTNGFYLPFTDVATTSGSNAGLGKDFSGNGNYWTTNNISVTSGATYDSMTDVPTLTSATTANYCTWNPLLFYSTTAPTVTNGNLTAGWNNTSMFCGSTMTCPSTGKTYVEFTLTTANTTRIGIKDITDQSQYNGGYTYVANTGTIRNTSDTTVQTVATSTNGDIIGIAVDLSANTIQFYKNNTAIGTAVSIANSANWAFWVGQNSSGSAIQVDANFGQRPFAYTPPTGFKALNTFNLPDSTIVAGNKVMDATLYTGTGSSLTITNAGSFKPDFLWLKTRQSGSHALIDSVRGVNKVVNSNNTDAENTSTTGTGLTSFNSNGFTLGSNNSGTGTTNYIGDTFVAWQWQAGQGTTSSNTSGSITSTTSVNASAGFSIVTYTGTATAATIGHGLGVAPKMIIVKRRDSAGNNIPVYHISTGAANVPYLENTTGYFTRSGNFNDTAPTSTVFSVGGTGQSDYTNTNASGGTYVAYCWSEIAGFSKFGSYTGNGSTDGPFIYLGFRPKFVMYKNSSAVNSWIIEDTSRLGYNASNYNLYPNLSNAEGSYTGVDILSNGFKMRNADSGFNDSGNTYIYAAFAENPFKNSLAR